MKINLVSYEFITPEEHKYKIYDFVAEGALACGKIYYHIAKLPRCDEFIWNAEAEYHKLHYRQTPFRPKYDIMSLL